MGCNGKVNMWVTKCRWGKTHWKRTAGAPRKRQKQCKMTRASGGVGTDGRRRLFAQNGFYGGV